MKKTSNKIVFFGNEKLATGVTDVQPVIREALANAGFDIEKVINGPLSSLGAHESKLAVLAAYGRIIPPSVLDQFPLGIINVHPSLLPQYRGPTPIEQAILDGAGKTGVSIMRLTAGMDEGPLYKQKTLHLTGQESKAELTQQLQKLGSEMLIEILPGIADGSLKPHRQPHSDRATYSHKLTKEDGRISWPKPAVNLEREIRAYFGWPGSYTTLAGKEVIVTAARVEQAVDSRQQAAEPGDVFVAPHKQLAIQTGDGILVIERLRPAGGKEMPSMAFIAGHKQMLN